MKVQEVITRAIDGKITWTQAAQILGYSDRHIRRLKEKIAKDGFEVLLDKRIGKSAVNRIPENTTKEVLSLFRDKYFDFNTKHFHEQLIKEHKLQISYTWTKATLQNAGLIKKESKRNTHRKKRERKELPGMMIHLDASTHPWFGDNPCDLLITLDDATSEIYDGLFCEQESTLSCLEVLKNTTSLKGIFCSLYTDKASHFVTTHKKNMSADWLQKEQDARYTQVQKALSKLGTKLIPANSPQARGRSERMWQTLQGRLPQELRLNKITNINDANKFLKETFIPKMNSLFMVQAKSQGSAFVQVHPSLDLDHVFSVEHSRIVKHDNTVQFKKLSLQIPESKFRCSFAKCQVTILELINGDLHILYGPQLLAKFNSSGELKTNNDLPTKNAA